MNYGDDDNDNEEYDDNGKGNMMMMINSRGLWTMTTYTCADPRP